MNAIFIIPTGLGASIGGHAGDATPAARLIGAACDNIILHPNVVNASDINEMPKNSLYVMGVTIDDFLSGYVGLAPIYQNRIAVVVNKPVPNEIVNIVSAARATLGIDAFIVGLPEILKMEAGLDKYGAATGVIKGAQEAAEYLQGLNEDFDAVAIFSKIDMNKSIAEQYIQEGGVNPWGRVEAKLTRILTNDLKVPCAHAPFGHTLDDYNDIVDPRIAAEMVSVTYAFCVLKGLHKSPEITDCTYGITVKDIDVLVTPAECYGVPHQRCLEKNIPIITVAENTVLIQSTTVYPSIKATTYAEAAGIILAMKEGISLESIRRPLKPTKIIS